MSTRPMKPQPFPGESPTVALALAAGEQYGLHPEEEAPKRTSKAKPARKARAKSRAAAKPARKSTAKTKAAPRKGAARKKPRA